MPTPDDLADVIARTSADLLALADRVESEEPSIALNVLISAAAGVSDRAVDWLHSLDASASLMPEGWTLYSITPAYGGLTAMLQRDATDTLLLARGFAPDEPRARTAAALRARAQEIADEG